MEKLTHEEIRELRESVHQLNHVLRSFDEGGYRNSPNRDAAVTSAWKDADERYQRIASQMRAKGIEDDEDLDLAWAQLKNPLYREPVSLGHIITDESDFDIEPAGMEMD